MKNEHFPNLGKRTTGGTQNVFEIVKHTNVFPSQSCVHNQTYIVDTMANSTLHEIHCIPILHCIPIIHCISTKYTMLKSTDTLLQKFSLVYNRMD